MPRYAVRLHPSAQRAFAKFEVSVQRRLSAALDALAEDPRPPGSKRLVTDQDLWRVRVGAYRIVYAIEDDQLLILVVKLGPRHDVYRGL